MFVTLTRLCHRCRAVQPPKAARCIRCDHDTLSAPVHEPGAFLTPRRRSLTFRRSPKNQPVAYGCSVTMLAIFVSLVAAVVVFEKTGSVGAGVAVLLGLGVAVPFLAYSPFPGLRDRGYIHRLTLARLPRLALPSPSHITIAGAARALDGRTVPSFVDGSPCLATSLFVGDPPDRIAAEKTTWRPFLVVVDDVATVLDGTLYLLGDPDAATPLSLPGALTALGLERLDAEGGARVLTVRDGDLIEATGEIHVMGEREADAADRSGATSLSDAHEPER